MSNSKIPAAYKDIVELAAPEICFLEIGQSPIYARQLSLNDQNAILWTIASVEETLAQDKGSFLPAGYIHVCYSPAHNDFMFLKEATEQADNTKPAFLIALSIDTERSYAGISNSQFAAALASLIEGKTIKMNSLKPLNSLRVFAWRKGHRVTIDKLELTAKYAGMVDKMADKGNIYTIIEDDTPPKSLSIGELL